MIIKESQVKAIIQEEIQKMIEEGEIEEGWFSDARKGVGKYFANKAAQLGGLSSTDIRDQAADKESEESDEEFRAETERGTARQKEIMFTYNKIMSGLSVAEKGLIDLEDYLSREEGNKVSKAADEYMRQVESAVEKALGYKAGSLR